MKWSVFLPYLAVTAGVTYLIRMTLSLFIGGGVCSIIGSSVLFSSEVEILR